MQHPEPSQSPQQPDDAAPTRSVSDPKATFDDLPFTPVLTKKQATRANQTFKGMLLSVLFTLAVVLPIIFLNPISKDNERTNEVDLQQIAQQSQQVADFKIFTPEFSGGEYANFARWKAAGTDGVAYWEFGLVLSENEFVWVRQTSDANPTWLANISDNAPITDELVMDGDTWQVRSKGESTYMISEREDSTLILSSDTGEEELMTVLNQAQRNVP